MSSTERAPEPTMEEILASIRRIISEDEANGVTPEAEPLVEARSVPSYDSEEGAADIQIIDDIARVLGANAQPASAQDDEILDLTDLGLSEMADEAPQVVEELVVTEYVEETSIQFEPQQSRSFADAFPSAESASVEVIEMAPPEPVYEAAPVYVPPAPQAEAAPPPVFVAPEPTPMAEDPTLALERAIEALKAGDLAAFARAAENKYVPPAPPPIPAAAPPPPVAEEPLPTAGPSLAEQFGAEEEVVVALDEELVILAEPEPVIEPEPEFVAEPDLEAEIVFVAEEEVSWSEPESAPEPQAVATPWHADDATWAPRTTPPAEFASPARGTNGGSSHKSHDFEVAEPKTLEDSVREMLRPMLRKWLDENMQRVLTQALREELEDPEARRRQG